MADEPAQPRKTRSERLAEVHERAMRRFDAIWAQEREERLQSLSDRRFATIRGAQWEGQYAFGEGPLDDNGDPIETGLPRMEVPKFYRPMRRALGEYRSSRKTVDFKPKGQDSDKRSADNLDGLYRADENDTPGGGQAAYANAFQEGLKGGRGGWRYRPVYEDESDEENEHQRIRIEPVYDADQRMFFDVGAQLDSKLDARHGFLLEPYSPEAFKEAWPKHSEATFDQKHGWNYDWVTPDVIMVAQYYEIEDKSVLRRTFRNLATEEELTFDDTALTEGEPGETKEDELLATGWEEVRQRKIKRQRVHKYVLSGCEVLEDSGIIPGKYVPLAPYYADRCIIDGIERCQGIIRPVIDPTRIYNLMVSGLAEAAAGPATDTPIIAPEQVPGNYANIWASRNIQRPAYLPLEPIRNHDGDVVQAGLSGTLPVAQVSPNMAALVQVAGADIADIMGDGDRPETVPSNTSADAIELVNDEADTNDFLWRDNFSVALQTGGAIWLEMAKELYVEEGREMIAIDDKGKQSVVTLAQNALDAKGGQFLKNDLTSGDYDVVVDVGPATKTKQKATARTMLAIAETAVAAQKMDWASGALGVAILNMDGEGIDAFQHWVRQQGLQEGWVEPNQEEAQQLQEQAANAQPDPQSQLVMAAASQAQAEAQKAVAQTGKAVADTEKVRAETAATLAEIDREDRAQVLEEIRHATDVQQQDFDQQQVLSAPEDSDGDAA